MAWRKRDITVLLRRNPADLSAHASNGLPLVVPAVVDGHLAVHRTVRLDGSLFRRGYWTVTHVGSGRRLCGTGSKKSAKQTADILAPLTDWQQYDAIPNAVALPAHITSELCRLRWAGVID